MSITNIMGQMAIQKLMNQLQQTNPQMYNLVIQAYQRNANPNDLINQILSNYSPEQKEEFFKQAKQYGISDNVLNQFK